MKYLEDITLDGSEGAADLSGWCASEEALIRDRLAQKR